MAEISPEVPHHQEEERIPFWRDARIIGVIAQIIFVVFLVLGTSTSASKSLGSRME